MRTRVKGRLFAPDLVGADAATPRSLPEVGRRGPAAPGNGSRVPACPFLTALQSALQPLPQLRCRNERSRVSSSRRHSILHCPIAKRLEMKRRAPSVEVQTSLNYSPRKGEEERTDWPAVKDRPAFWALPPWPMESLVILRQLFVEVLQDPED